MDNPGRGIRLLGIPTVQVRLLQQAMAQVLDLCFQGLMAEHRAFRIMFKFETRIELPSWLAASCSSVFLIHFSGGYILRDDYLRGAQEVITDPMILVNVVSRRAKQLKSGYKPLIESLERLSAEDMALREIMEGKITYQLDEETLEV